MSLKTIPDKGIQGDAALREAAAGDYRAIMQLVRVAVSASMHPGVNDSYISVEAIYDDRVVVHDNGRLYSYLYTLNDDNQVTIGAREEVVLDHKPVAFRESQGVFIESKDDEGLKWRILVIEAGLSLNKNFYPDAVLREAVAMFDGVRVFVKADGEHLKGEGKSFKNLIGGLSNPVFIEGKGADSGRIEADFDVLKSSGDVPAKMLEAHQRGMANLFGFSIDADGKAKREKGRVVAQKITKVNSVDLIIEPGAGGQIINLIEAVSDSAGTNTEEQEMALRQRMIEAVKKANKGNLPDGLDVDNDEALDKAYREALQADNAAPTKKIDNADAGADVQEQIRMVEARAEMKVVIGNSNLPSVAQSKLINQFAGTENFKEADVTKAIKGELDYLANFSESGHVSDTGGSRFEAGEDRSQKVNKMFDAFFDPNDRSVRSFKECYVEITGDAKVSGHLRDCNMTRLRESMGDAHLFEALNSASWSNLLGDGINRRMLVEYALKTNLDAYKLLTGTAVPLTDFRTKENVRYGGYGDLPIVVEDGVYAALTSPSDEKSSYAPAKRGGTETISLEMVKNDDVGAIQRLPTKLSRAAKRTLSKFIFDFVANNPVIFDSVTLFHATHNNLGSAALSPAALSVQRLAMMQQVEAGSNEPTFIPPRNLFVPAQLEEAGFDMFRRATNNDTDFVESLQMNVIPVWCWTDANDWMTAADVADIPFIELGFMDGNEEPELFVQDSPTQGSLFSNDQIKYKIRHTYGAGVSEFRGVQKNVVI